MLPWVTQNINQKDPVPRSVYRVVVPMPTKDDLGLGLKNSSAVMWAK